MADGRDAPHATFVRPDLGSFCRLDELGLLVGALVAAGYQVYAVNPRAVDRYRDRHGQAGAKSDAGDARVLADLVRTDRHQHRRVAGDSELAEAIKSYGRKLRMSPSHESAAYLPP